jgi:hypothetical protein
MLSKWSVEIEVMRLPRVRFTVDRMMAAVALVAVILGALRLGYVAFAGILIVAICVGCLILDRH